MALSDDFGMYYCSTYVGYRDPEHGLLPFQIEAVTHDNNVMNLRAMSASDRETLGFSDDALDALVFHGTVRYPNGNYENRSVPHTDDKLVLELPDSRYIKWRNRYYWVSYRANRSTKKGLTSRRVCGMPVFDWDTIAEFFSERKYPEVSGNVFLKTDDDLRYKDVYIGKFVGEGIELFPEAAHLLRSVSQEYPECQTVVSTS